MGNDSNQKATIEHAKKVAGKMYDVSDYKSKEALDKGIAITHEQVSDNYTEGNIDGKIDALTSKDELKTHDGKAIPRKGFEK